MKPPRILVTNDDGIDSPGIYALWEAMSKVGTPTVIAPRTEQSAASHSITLNKPLFLNYISRNYGFEGWSVDGTPADCTKIGINEVLKHRPDLIISGINCGANLGVDLIYSGTLFNNLDFDFIINISEDGWFGQSIGPKQHFVHSIFRAIESGKYIIRSSNNGIAGIINPLGNIEKNVNYGDTGYVDLKQIRTIQPTIFSIHGNKIFGLLILLYIFLIFSFKKIKYE